MVFCNVKTYKVQSLVELVTILILIDGFLQWVQAKFMIRKTDSHNPYFNRWFSAINKVNQDFLSFDKSQSLF